MPKPNGGKGGNSGDGGNPNPITIAGQLQLLNDIQVIEFACSPATVQPFQTTVVSYAVEPLPIGLDLPVTFSINGNKVGTGHSGSFSFSVNTDTTFKLLAANKVTSADIATTQVTVDPSQCSPGTILGIIIASQIMAAINTGFGSFTTGSTATLTDYGAILVHIPCNLPRNAGTLTIDFTIGVYQSQSPPGFSVTRQSLTSVVHLNTDLNVDSWCSNGMQELVQFFMQHIIDYEIIGAQGRGGLVDQIAQQINSTINAAEQSDPNHRTFNLTTFALTSAGISYQVCPT